MKRSRSNKSLVGLAILLALFYLQRPYTKRRPKTAKKRTIDALGAFLAGGVAGGVLPGAQTDSLSSAIQRIRRSIDSETQTTDDSERSIDSETQTTDDSDTVRQETLEPLSGVLSGVLPGSETQHFNIGDGGDVGNEKTGIDIYEFDWPRAADADNASTHSYGPFRSTGWSHRGPNSASSSWAFLPNYEK